MNKSSNEDSQSKYIKLEQKNKRLLVQNEYGENFLVIDLVNQFVTDNIFKSKYLIFK